MATHNTPIFRKYARANPPQKHSHSDSCRTTYLVYHTPCVTRCGWQARPAAGGAVTGHRRAWRAGGGGHGDHWRPLSPSPPPPPPPPPPAPAKSSALPRRPAGTGSDIPAYGRSGERASTSDRRAGAMTEMCVELGVSRQSVDCSEPVLATANRRIWRKCASLNVTTLVWKVLKVACVRR